MMRSLFAAISGLKAHQEMLDVTANDIANVNTVGFKSSRTSFKDALSQLQSGASGPGASLGGTNAQQIGLGVQVGAVQNVMTSGALQSTGNTYDLAIQGTGWFRVAGIQTAGTPPTFGTTYYTRAGNFTTDANGNLVTQEGNYVLGNDCTAQGPPPTFSARHRRHHHDPGRRDLRVDRPGRRRQLRRPDHRQHGRPLADHPRLVPERSRACRRSPAPSTRSRANSGTPTVGVPGDTNGLGTIAPGELEMSNVDLAQEFTNMIEAQRGFQANGRVITTADQMLQTLVQLGQG